MLKKIAEFFNEVKGELKKVSWPSRQEVIHSTSIVVVTIMLLASFLWLIDMGLQSVVSAVIR